MVETMNGGAAVAPADVGALALVGAAAGWLAFMLVALWPMASGRRALLGWQGASAGAFAVHYAALGAWTGAAMAGLSVVQVVAAWAESRPWWRGAVYLATIPVVAWLAWDTWAGWASACAAAGLLLATLGRWQMSTARLRLLFLGAALAWAAHDALVSSLPGLLADVAAVGTLVYGLVRDHRAAPAAGVA